jgi:hypothetical protein
MNPLVEYLLKHHNPGGNAIQHVRIDDFIDETEWTRKEIMDMALEARENRLVTMTMKTGYRVRDMDPEGLDLIGLWNEVYRKMGSKSVRYARTSK